MENTLGSEAYVKNILTLFAENPRLGQVTPPPPYHALYFAHTIPHDWGANYEITKELLEDRLGIHVPLSPTKPTASAMGSCYWFRVEALNRCSSMGGSMKTSCPKDRWAKTVLFRMPSNEPTDIYANRVDIIRHGCFQIDMLALKWIRCSIPLHDDGLVCRST